MLVILIIACLLLFLIWTKLGRRPPAAAPDLRLRDTSSFGADTGCGNLLALQPYMTAGDYASEERFHAKLDAYLAEAGRRGFIGPKTVAVFPEYLGAWLIAAGEKQSVHRAPTADRAAALLVACNPLSFLRSLPSAHAPDRARSALFKMKARPIAAIYQRVFSRLAKDYAVTIVAGSTILPDPQIREGELTCGNGPLYNVSVVYGPDGRALGQVVRKAFPVEEELRYLKPGRLEDLPVFDTPAGRLAVLICADSWFPQTYQALKSSRVDIIAVPAFVYPSSLWEQPWPGYSGAPMPADVPPDDVGSITEHQAWLTYALPARIAASGARAGVTVFFKGRIWDLSGAGQPIAVLGHSLHTTPHTDAASILNLWLPAT